MRNNELWQTIRLGDICSKIGSGATPRGGKSVYQAEGTSLIRSQNIYNNRFVRDGLAFIGEPHAEKLDGVTVQEGDVLLNITGDSVARVCQAPASVLPARVNQHVAIIRPNSEILNQRFLRYYLVSPGMQEFMLSIASSGGTRKALTKGMIEDFQIPCPPIQEQNEIARIIGALDRKLILNKELTQTIMAMANCIYRAWFTSSSTTDPLTVSELTELGVIRVEDGNHGEYRPRRHEFCDDGVLFIRAADMDDGRIIFETAEAINEEAVARIRKGIGQQGDVLFSHKGTVGKLAIAPEDAPPFVCSPQTTFWRVTDSSQMNRYVLYHWMNSDEFLDQVHMVKGQTDMADYVSLTDQRRIRLNLPRGEAQQLIGERLATLHARVETSRAESRTLRRIRNVLLRKLFSGELRMPYVKAELSEVAS